MSDNNAIPTAEPSQRPDRERSIPERWQEWSVKANPASPVGIAIQEICDLEARVRELEQALRDLMKLIDDGILLRDTSHDGEPGWAMRQLPIVRVLQQGHAALHVSDPGKHGTDKAAKP